jgi:hypothetical protein
MQMQVLLSLIVARLLIFGGVFIQRLVRINPDQLADHIVPQIWIQDSGSKIISDDSQEYSKRCGHCCYIRLGPVVVLGRGLCSARKAQLCD